MLDLASSTMSQLRYLLKGLLIADKADNSMPHCNFSIQLRHLLLQNILSLLVLQHATADC